MAIRVRSWEEIEEGHGIPALVKKPTYMQLFMFSAITWNRHLIHYNSEFAHHDGLKDVAVHRALMGSFLAQMLTDWLSEAGRVAKIEWSVRGGAAPGDTLTCRGRVLSKKIESGEKLVECEVWIEKDGETIVPGKATVKFFSQKG